MHYVRRRESARFVVPLLAAAGALSLCALIWRRLAAPRTARTMSHRESDIASAGVPPSGPTHGVDAGPDAQLVHDGSGPLVHRRYDVLITGTTLGAGALLQLLQRHLSELAPAALAHFEKSEGRDGLTRVGDEYEITMLGPWNGRVRVIESATRHFTLVTLDGHPEAGHITFSVEPVGNPPDTLRVLIESRARARDSVVELAYGTLGVGKQVQTEVWITFLQRLSALAGVEGTPEVRMSTEELAPTGAQLTAARDA